MIVGDAGEGRLVVIRNTLRDGPGERCEVGLRTVLDPSCLVVGQEERVRCERWRGKKGGMDGPLLQSCLVNIVVCSVRRCSV